MTPSEKLKMHKQDIDKYLKLFDNSEALLGFISDKIGKYFSVSGGVISRRINKENLEHYCK